MSFIRSNDATIYYEEYGTGEPLILLPGLLGTIESHWRRFVPELGKHFRTIAVDLRGHGRTNNPSQTLSINTFLNDLENLFNALEIDRAHLCGYSLGGYIGLAYGLEHPRSIASVATHGTKFYWTREAIDRTLKTLDPGNILAKIPAWAEALQRDHAPGNGENGWKDLLKASSAFIKTWIVIVWEKKFFGALSFPYLFRFAMEMK
ncbi:MAG: alpha/beta fold hydrolase [Bacteroidota bacterium]